MTSLDRIAGISAGIAYKAPVKVATDQAITLSGAQTVNSVAVVAGDRVLVKDQADQTENGIYDVAETAWTRSLDFDGNRDVVYGSLVSVASSATQLVQYRLTTANPVVIGTSNITFSPVSIELLDRGDGRTILEVGSVTDASAEFLSGATFTLDPANPRHYNVQVGDASTPLTADMVVDLAPDSNDWPSNCRVTIIKGSSDDYAVTVLGLNADGLGTLVLRGQYDSAIFCYQTTDDDDGPGVLGQKFAAKVRVIYRDVKTISKSAAAWTADTSTVLAAGQIGHESDTDEIKFGNGSDLWSGLDYYTGGDGSTPVSMARTQPTAKTASFQLDDDHTTTTFDEGTQVLLVDRFVSVDPAAATEIELNSAHDVGTKYETHTADEDYTVTLVRETVPIPIVGDTTDTSDIITNIVDKSAVENGDLYVGSSFTGGTVVLDKDYASGQIQMSNAATVTAAGVDIDLTGKRGTINGVQGDLVFRKGIQMIEVVGTALGVDAIVRGDIEGGGGPFTPASITSTGNTNMAGTHFGKSIRVTSASGTPTFTFLTEANYGDAIQDGTWIKFYWDGAATSFTFVQGSGTTLSYDADQTLAMKAKGTVTAEYLGSEEWALSGALILA